VLKGLVPQRRAHHEIDMARMHVETGDYERATARVLGAERTAPQMTRFHPSARAVVGHLVDVRRTPAGTVARVAGPDGRVAAGGECSRMEHYRPSRVGPLSSWRRRTRNRGG
jgi:hypothetical protein